MVSSILAKKYSGHKMKRSGLWVLLCCFLSLNCSQVREEDDSRPNIIFILTDDQRFDALGYAGNGLVHTPEMDRLAETGTYFKNAMVSTPICAASRASLLTGLYERTHRYTFQTGDIRGTYMETSYPRLLREAGYHTGFYGKYGVKYTGLHTQFDSYESYDRNGDFDDRRGYFFKTLGKDTVHLTRYTGQKALDFIEDASSTTPFCLSLSFSAPHAHDPAKDQYFWQPETDILLQDTLVPGPNLGEDHFFAEQPDFVKSGFNRLRWTWRYDTPEKYQHSVKGYYRMISGIDLEIAKIRALLKKRDMHQNTVIVIMGDNGYFLGERQMAGKWLLYDNSLRVPLIIYDPRAKVHRTVEDMVLNIDVPSTILDLAGLEPPKSWHGESLKPIVHGEKKGWDRDTVLLEHIWEFEHIPPSEGVRTKDWKYFRYVNDKSVEELYHLKTDPKEVNNLASDENYQAVLVKLRQKSDALIARYSDGHSAGPTGLGTTIAQGGGADRDVAFHWQLPPLVASQSAYQILVATSEEKLGNNIGDLWDSGRVEEPWSPDIEHKGLELKRGNTYFWKARIFDEENRLSAYSDSHLLKME